MNGEPRNRNPAHHPSSEAHFSQPDRAAVLRSELAERADVFFQALEDHYFRDDGDEVDEAIGRFLQEQRLGVKRAVEKGNTRNTIVKPFMLLAACHSDSLRARGRQFLSTDAPAPVPRDVAEIYFLYAAREIFSERRFAMQEVVSSLGEAFLDRLPETLRIDRRRRVSEFGLQGIASLTPDQAMHDPERALAELRQLRSENSFYGFVRRYLERELLPGLIDARRTHDGAQRKNFVDQIESLARIFWELVNMEETLEKAVQHLAPREERLPIHRYHLPRGVRSEDVFATVYAPYDPDTCRAISEQFFHLGQDPYVCTYILNEYTETGARIPREKVVRVRLERGTLVVEGEINAKETGIENIGPPDRYGSPDLHELKIMIPANWISLDDHADFVYGTS